MALKREQSNAAISYHLIHTICQRPVNSIKVDYPDILNRDISFEE